MIEIAGIIIFLSIMGLGFWMLIFLAGFMIPYWITKAVMYKEEPESEENQN